MRALFELEKTPINDGWKVLKIKRVLEISITDGPHETPELLDEGIPFLSAESVKKGKLDFNLKRGYISQEDHEKYIKKCKPQRDDIFMIKSGATTGNVAMVETDEEFSIWSPLALIRADKEKILPKYLYYFIGSVAFREQVEMSWSFGTQQNIGMKVIENLFISLPPLQYQEMLVQYIENKVVQIDKLIEMKQQKICLLEQQRQSIIMEAVTKGLNLNVKLKDSGVEWIGEIPEHWAVKKIAWLFNLIASGSTPSTNKDEYYQKHIPWLNTGDLNDDYVDTPSKYISQKALEDFSTLKIYPENSLIMAMYGATIGKLGITKFETTTNQACCVLSQPNEVEMKFMFYWLMGNRERIIQMAQGGGQPNISQGIIKSIRLGVPPLKEQKLIVENLNKKFEEFNKIIQMHKESIDSLNKYRKALIYEAVTGKIDVRELKLD